MENIVRGSFFDATLIGNSEFSSSFFRIFITLICNAWFTTCSGPSFHKHLGHSPMTS